MVVGTMLFSGIRISEVLPIWNDEIDSEGWVQVNRKVSTAHYPNETDYKARFFDPKNTKGNKPNRAKRKTPIVDATFLKRLLEWKASHTGKFLFLNDDGQTDLEGRKLSATRKAINDEIEAALKQAVIDRHITSHCLRHTFVSLLIAMGKPLEEVSKFCGHSDTMVTDRVYRHFFEKREKEKNTIMAEYERYMNEHS